MGTTLSCRSDCTRRCTDVDSWLHATGSQQQQIDNDAEKSQQIHVISSTNPDRLSPAIHCLPPIPFMESKLHRNQGEQLRCILLELVTSERVFMNDLHTLFARFVLPSGLQFMMQCVHDVHRLHNVFLRSLEITLGPVILAISHRVVPYNEIKLVLLRLFELFISKCAQFKVYSDYTFAYIQFQRLRNEQETFFELILAFSQSIGGIQTVDSLLIKPVQRILKYPLFLDQLHDICAEKSEERTLCVKALKQMRSLANWLNEMQRIQEDYGVQLDSISRLFNGTFCSPLASLNSLKLFAHVRLVNQSTNSNTDCAATSTTTTFDCALLVFPTVLIVVERQHSLKQPDNVDTKNGILPLVLPLGHIQLLFQQNPLNADVESKQQKDGTTSLLVSRKKKINAARFSLAVRAQTDPLDTHTDARNTFAEFIPSMRIFHFECCHADVCRYLALTLQHQKHEHQSREGTQIVGTNHNSNKWRMEASIDSSCSSSSDRGYVSGVGAVEEKN